jgi:hypothetical protein
VPPLVAKLLGKIVAVIVAVARAFVLKRIVNARTAEQVNSFRMDRKRIFVAF